MELEIISPYQTKKFSIAWLEVHTAIGSFVIQTGHVPTILILSPDKPITFCLKNGKQESIHVRQGVIEITRESATLLMNESI